MKSLSRSLIILGSSVLLFLAGVFGTSVLNNLHLKYLRGLGQNVVLIHNLAGSGATGFIVTGKSGKVYVMTNNHVCGLEEQGDIFGTYREKEYPLKVIKRYPYNDLCVMTPPSTAMKGFKIAKSYELGESAFAIGHPQLEPLSISVGELSDIITVRIVVKVNAKKEECSGPTYTLDTEHIPPLAMLMGIENLCVRAVLANTSSIIIEPGNSGSAILNIWGSVIGVAFAANDHGTRSYIVPLYDLKNFLETL